MLSIPVNYPFHKPQHQAAKQSYGELCGLGLVHFLELRSGEITMATAIKDRITDDLQKAKQEGGLVADRIREIVKLAVTESVGEIKQGSGEIKTIARDAIAAVMELVKEKQHTAKADLMASIEGVIDGIRASRQTEIDQTQTQIAELETTLDVQAQELNDEVENALVAIETSVNTPPDSETTAAPDFQTLLTKALATVRETKQFAIAQEQYTKLRDKLAQFDDQLTQRYGDRYAQIKHQFESSWASAKQWYVQQRADIATGKPTPVETLQAALDTQAAKAGTVAAQTEQELKTQVKSTLNGSSAD